LDEALLDEFDENDKLNITGGDKDDDVFDPEIQKEYENFMKQMNTEGYEHEGMESFSNLMTNLLSNINKNLGDEE
jgi:hypothetical protein